MDELGLGNPDDNSQGQDRKRDTGDSNKVMRDKRKTRLQNITGNARHDSSQRWKKYSHYVLYCNTMVK